VYTADGRVLGVEHGPSDSPATTVSIVIQPDGAAPVHVELAPGWYLDRRGIHFSEQDRVHVEGRRDDRSGSTVVVARRIRKDGSTIELRNDADEPTWEH